MKLSYVFVLPRYLSTIKNSVEKLSRDGNLFFNLHEIVKKKHQKNASEIVRETKNNDFIVDEKFSCKNYTPDRHFRVLL